MPQRVFAARAARPANQDSALTLFKMGKFAEAERLYLDGVARSAGDRGATVQLGRLALMSNRFAEAEKWLGRALELEPNDTAAKQLLAETYYRQDRFAEAAPLLRASGDDLKARLLESFQDRRPYQLEGSADEARLEFVQTDPIPVVKVRANGRDAYFIIDTGASEVYLEPDFAKSIGALVVSGAERGGFAGGQTRLVEKGRIDSLTLDRFTVRNVPVNIVDTKFIGRDQVAKVKISGFLGTVLLYHFLPTLDYPAGRLVLRRKGDRTAAQLVEWAARGEQTVLPFWMTGSHLMVTWGSAHGSRSRLFLIDTGGAGVGFVPGPSLVKEAGIELPKEADQSSGGALAVRFFHADAVSVGPLTEREVRSVFGPFPAQMETGLGFDLAGIVSHEFFKHYAFTIDYAGMRYFMKRKA